MRAHRLRGFTLVEAVLVLILVGSLSAAFVPIISGSGALGSALTAQTTASAALDAMSQAYSRNSDAPAAPCPAAPAAPAPGVADNSTMFTDPCALARVTGDLRFIAATVTSSAPSVASVGGLESAGQWVAAAAVSEELEAGAAETTCWAAVAAMPGGAETFVTFHAPVGGCTAAAAIAATGEPDACPDSSGQSWRKICTLAANE